MGDIFSENQSFDDLGLRNSVLKSVKEMGFEHPTLTQALLMPAIMAGKDVMGQAKTGTGKTAAFGLPILHAAEPDTPFQALVLVPTRELSAQVSRELDGLGKHTPIRSVSIVGGESYDGQLKGLRGGAQIIVGTPGRVMDLLNRREIRFDNLRWVVLDEVDRMLDIGFRDDIRKLLSRVKTEHQTVFVSATISEEIERLARQFMKPDAEKLVAYTKSLTVSQVTQHYLTVQPWDKRRLLTHLLTHEDTALTVVFCRTKRTVSNVTKYMSDKGIDAFEIHGDLPQGKRNRIMERLRSGRLEVLVASDLASRGLDVPNITHIINYDLPEDPEIYVHRIGRTARAGRNGTAWSFVCPDEGHRLTEIEKLTGVLIDKMEYPDFKPGPVPDRVQEELAAEQKVKDSARSRYQVTIGELARTTTEADPALFPGGVVPKGPPRRSLASRLPTRRRKIDPAP